MLVALKRGTVRLPIAKGTVEGDAAKTLPSVHSQPVSVLPVGHHCLNTSLQSLIVPHGRGRWYPVSQLREAWKGMSTWDHMDKERSRCNDD
jgi:hypothetical protein